LPRELTSTEIGEIIRGLKSNIDIEIFIIAEGCGGFIDGFCNFFHCFEGELKDKGKSMGKPVFFRTSYNTEQPNRGCIFYFSKMRKKHYKIINLRPNKERIKLSYQKNKDRSFGCRICDLYDLKTYPIQSLKIIGRGNNCLYTAKLIRTVRTAISYLENNNIPKKDFRLKCRDLFSKKILKNKRRCTKFDCYFNHHWIRTDHEEVGA
jgi:collagenase-like PrtC family protease